ncbi:hypothetical protein Galf_1362 [Gallionella capsiferriformans ES-2]|jgi:hypothetical protein|uniref:Uncharacterized protein n=1 Tax=Gallionella capsiferriformans (strain ES-2) TaxID=395494 RepID=D9SFU1_GALCS|nr:hypothetical protein Galf_1362 [Gallionella capsiferriformans ES-2]
MPSNAKVLQVLTKQIDWLIFTPNSMAAGCVSHTLPQGLIYDARLKYQPAGVSSPYHPAVFAY